MKDLKIKITYADYYILLNDLNSLRSEQLIVDLFNCFIPSKGGNITLFIPPYLFDAFIEDIKEQDKKDARRFYWLCLNGMDDESKNLYLKEYGVRSIAN